MTSHRILVVGLGLALLSMINHPLSCSGQGALTPPGAPAPTMKSLDQIEARTPISTLPFTISGSGSYYLTTNLTGLTGTNGITISAGNVTLDLNGFALAGVPGSGRGIYVSDIYTNITVRNGTVSDWGRSGVSIYNGENQLLENLRVSGGPGSYGIHAYGAVVRGCTVENSGTNASIYVEESVVRECAILNSPGIGIDAEAGSEVLGCIVKNSYSDGIDAYDSEVRQCVAKDNGYGIYAAPATVQACHVQDNYFSGIFVDWSGCQIAGNTCVNNNSSASQTDAGIYVNDANNRIENNHVTGSGNAGIQVDSYSSNTNNVIIKNTVTDNGPDDYVLPPGQIAGPLITTTGVIVNSNPWANFSF